MILTYLYYNDCTSSLVKQERRQYCVNPVTNFSQVYLHSAVIKKTKQLRSAPFVIVVVEKLLVKLVRGFARVR